LVLLEGNAVKIQIIYFGKTYNDLVKKICRDIDKEWSFVTLLDDNYLKTFLTDPTPCLLICEQEFVDQSTQLQKLLKKKLSDLLATLVILQEDTPPFKNFEELVEYLSPPILEWRIIQSVQRLVSILGSKKQIMELETKLSLQSQELSELNQIGIALSSERDPGTLAELILTKAREITSADAGSIYLVEKNQEIPADDNNFWSDKQLRFKLAHNDSVSASYNEFVMPVAKKSMAGYTALTGKPLNIRDAYMIPKDSEFQHNRSFDEKMGYWTKSVLCIPMLSHQGDMIGVLQLINRKKNWKVKLTSTRVIRDQVIPFDKRCVDLASSLASQAAVSIENMRLYEEIKKLFEGFIVASVHAIEQRDPTTSGHSERVAALTVGLAEKIDRLDAGPYSHVKFTRDDIQQIKYASLLHDFGKIGVREHVLVKAKKLYPDQLAAIQFRFRFIKQALELAYSKDKVHMLLEKNRRSLSKKFNDIDSEFMLKLNELDSHLEFILQTNEPKLLADGGLEKLVQIGQLTFDHYGIFEPLLTAEDIQYLSIPRGSLSEDERKEIESHVIHTFNFLSRIPWASHLKAVPHIAYAHHEKLDGTGYPRRLNSVRIPLPAKMMTIADIYDALTAADRPYKKAVQSDIALKILETEMKDGKIDPELLKIFIESEIYKLVIKS
jgi:HD-GYP domain-containing protein (c-di-GMP phosphodiesterase class II)